MLEKMGWTEGTGLGAQRQGRTEPVECSSRKVRCKRGVAASGEQEVQDEWRVSREAELRAKSMELRLCSLAHATVVEASEPLSDGDSDDPSEVALSLSAVADCYQQGSKHAKLHRPNATDDCQTEEEGEWLDLENTHTQESREELLSSQQISGLVKRELYYKFSAENPRDGFIGRIGFREARERRVLDQVLRSKPGNLSDFVSIR